MEWEWERGEGERKEEGRSVGSGRGGREVGREGNARRSGKGVRGKLVAVREERGGERTHDDPFEAMGSFLRAGRRT